MQEICSHRTDFHGMWYLSIFRNCVEKIHVSLNSYKNKRVHYMETNIHLWSYFDHFFLELKISHINLKRNSKYKFYVKLLFFFENRAVYVMLKNTVQPNSPQMTVRIMCVSCCIPIATNAHSDCVVPLSNCTNGYTIAPQGYLTHTLPVLFRSLNLLKTKRNLLYIRNQFVPRSKHFPQRL